MTASGATSWEVGPRGPAEPPGENVAGLIALAERTAVPLGSGESLVGHRCLRPVTDAGALAVVTPDLARSEAWRRHGRLHSRLPTEA